MSSKEEEEELWEDLESIIEKATKAMKSGELVHQKSFGLFEAMSAVEIMDPKMDAGCRSNCLGSATLNNDDDSEDVSTIEQIMTEEKAVDVLDRLFARENSWHLGNALPPTVFSCLYLREKELEKLDDRVKVLSASTNTSTTQEEWVLKAFESLMKTCLPFCGLIKKIVEVGDVFEEEDFNPHDYGLNVPLPENLKRGGVDDDDILAGDELVQTYAKILANGEKDYRETKLHRRVRLRFALYRLFKRIADVPSAKNVQMIKADFAEARELVRFIVENEILSDIDDDFDSSPVFDASACAHALGNAPPRVVELLSIKKSYEYYEKLLDELEVVVEKLYDVSDEKVTLSSDDFFDKCRYIAEKDFMALSRSVAAYVSTVGGSPDSHLGVDSVDLCLRSVFAQIPTAIVEEDQEHMERRKECIREEEDDDQIMFHLDSFMQKPFNYVMKEIENGRYIPTTVLDRETEQETEGDPKQTLATFKDECQRTCSFLSRSYFATPARRRRKLRRCLDELSHLQTACAHMDTTGIPCLFMSGFSGDERGGFGFDYDAFDYELSETPEFYFQQFQIWAQRIVIKTQFDILKVGFHCELYKNYELSSIYWYMDKLVMYLMQIEEFIANCLGEYSEGGELTICEAQTFLARSNAAQSILSALEKTEHMKMPKKSFQLATPEARFFQRFAHFQANTEPAPFFWDDYENSLIRAHQNLSCEILLKLAHHNLQTVIESKVLRHHLDASKRCARLSAVCKLLTAIPIHELQTNWTLDIELKHATTQHSSSPSPAKEDDLLEEDATERPSKMSIFRDDCFFTVCASRANK